MNQSTQRIGRSLRHSDFVIRHSLVTTLQRVLLVAAMGLTVFCSRSVLAQTPPAAELPKPDADGFITLFDGKTLAGWEGLEGFWSVKDGAITGSETKEHPAPQTFLILSASKANPAQFANFELRLKYKLATTTGNSGVQFRSRITDPKTFKVGGYQFDMDADRRYDGTIYDEAGVAGNRATMSNRGEKTTWTPENKHVIEKLPESSAAIQKEIKAQDWNDAVIVAQGNHITCTINGHVTTDLTDNSPRALKEGVIAVQLHQGFVMDIQFKDIRIKLMQK